MSLKILWNATMESSVMKSKFRGCLLGSLLGDCLGAPYEGKIMSSGDRVTVQKYFDKLEDPEYKGLFRKYTDDTAMMKNVAKFLLDRPEPDYQYLAKLFVNEYFEQPRRGYGQNVVDIFYKLRNSKFEDIYTPASEQFEGSGSYGNGGAMRIAPIPLYFHTNYTAMLEVATNSTKITHTNILGINGAILQCIAIHQALMSNPKEKIDSQKFLDELYKKMKDVEGQLKEDDPKSTAYQDKIKRIEMLLLEKHYDDLDEEVIFMLGNGISAYESVPTAIYCFLRAQNDIPQVETENVYRRAIQYAITLGGDTDTIACMTGAITGAYLGQESINPNLIHHCELNEEILELADKLFEAQKPPTT